MDLEKNKQRLEILAAEIEELKNSGGDETVDAYTKEEADDKFAEKTNVYTKTEADDKFAEKATTYTKTEVDEAIAAAGGGGDLSDYLTKAEASSTYETQSAASSALELKADKATTYTKTEVDEAIASAAGGSGGGVIVSGDNVKTINATAGSNGILIGNGAGLNSGADSQIAIGVRSGANSPYQFPISIGYQAQAHNNGITIGSNSTDNGTGDNSTSVILGYKSTANSDNDVILGNHLNATANGQILLGRYNKTSDNQNYFAVGNGSSHGRSNLFSFSNNLFYCGNDTTGYDLRYFAPDDETLTNGGTILATTLVNANKHVPLSFNGRMHYYSYDDANNVYYFSIRLNNNALHTDIVRINKKTGVSVIKEFN